MREFKFRVWDKKIKAFTHWYRDPVYLTLDQGLFRHTGGDEPWRDLETEKCEENRYVIQQFTGCLDNSGKEIWEGDIVEDYEGNNIFEIKYEDNQFDFKRNDAKELIVIGNIFENPELLEEANNAR